jgi:ribosomal protein L29
MMSDPKTLDALHRLPQYEAAYAPITNMMKEISTIRDMPSAIMDSETKANLIEMKREQIQMRIKAIVGTNPISMRD